MTPAVSSALPRCTPESAGVPSSAVIGFLDAIAAAKLEIHSVMLSRAGRVFAEGWWAPFSADRPHIMYSLSKSFTSTAIGMLVDEGRLSIDDPVVKFFPEEVRPEATRPVEPGERMALQRTAQARGFAFADLDRVNIADDALASLPFELVRRHRVIPVKRDGRNLYVAMSTPDNDRLREELQLAAGCRVVPVLAVQAAIEVAIDHAYRLKNLRKMRVRDLLTMTTGNAEASLEDLFGREDGDWARGFFERPVPYEPGTHFLYNTAGTYMCSAILTRITGQSLLEYLAPRLFDPLGIEGATWTTCPKGVTYGGSGLSVRTEDIAKFGLLYLQKGLWNGKRLISEAWIDQATARQVPNGDDPNNDWNQGYGFQFWRCRHNCYRGDGAFGQYCVVIPETEMVVAMTSSVDDLGAVLQAVWDNLRYAPQAATLPEDASSHQRLVARLAELEVAGPAGAPTSPTAARVAGKWYSNDQSADEFRAVRFEFDTKGGGTMTLRSEAGERPIAVGGNHWDVHKTPLHNAVVALRGAWTDPDVYTIAMRCMDGPETRTISCRFTGDRVSCVETRRGYFGPPQGRTFEGRHAP